MRCGLPARCHRLAAVRHRPPTPQPRQGAGFTGELPSAHERVGAETPLAEVVGELQQAGRVVLTVAQVPRGHASTEQELVAESREVLSGLLRSDSAVTRTDDLVRWSGERTSCCCTAWRGPWRALWPQEARVRLRARPRPGRGAARPGRTPGDPRRDRATPGLRSRSAGGPPGETRFVDARRLAPRFGAYPLYPAHQSVDAQCQLGDRRHQRQAGHGGAAPSSVNGSIRPLSAAGGRRTARSCRSPFPGHRFLASHSARTAAWLWSTSLVAVSSVSLSCAARSRRCVAASRCPVSRSSAR